jgi:hypothetical protein
LHGVAQYQFVDHLISVLAVGHYHKHWKMYSNACGRRRNASASDVGRASAACRDWPGRRVMESTGGLPLTQGIAKDADAFIGRAVRPGDENGEAAPVKHDAASVDKDCSPAR